MVLVMSVFALVGLVIFVVGAILYLVNRPVNPGTPLIMVIGGLIYAVAQIVLLFDAIF
jgi:hypothetical protein